MNINRVVISGNLTRDPEMRTTQSGLSVMTFSVAVNDRHKNRQTGEWEEYPNFINCVVFGAYSETLDRYLYKGMKVTVEGKLRWSQWEKNGEKRSKIEVIVSEVEFMSRKNNDQSYESNTLDYETNDYSSSYSSPSYSSPSTTFDEPDTGSSIYDEDIPF